MGDGMTLVWNELRPQDRYLVHIVQPLSLYQTKTLTQLYQPLMGSTSYALYLTLSTEVDGWQHHSSEKNHQWLMNVMNVALDKLFHARVRLEALGLLKTYRKSATGDYPVFEYELLPPLEPKEFFDDDILSIYLYNQIGTVRYRALRAQYHANQFKESDDQKQEITKEFHEVFTSIHPSELMASKGTEMEKELQHLEKEYPLPTVLHDQENAPHYNRYPLNIEALKGFLMKGIPTEHILTEETLLELKKLAYFYQFDEWSMSRLIHDSLTPYDEIDLQVLREKAKETYRLQHGGKPPQLIHSVQPLAHRVTQNDNLEKLSEEDKHIQRMETISPLQLLEHYQGGGKVAEADLKLVESLLYEYDLYPGVVNTLIEYVLFTNEYKLPKNLVTKVAAHWKRLKIKTVKQAQDLAKKEHQQYKLWKTKSAEKNSQPNYNSKAKAKNVRTDQLPAWIEDQMKEEEKTDSPQQAESNQNGGNTQKKERIESLLKALGEWDEEGEKF